VYSTVHLRVFLSGFMSVRLDTSLRGQSFCTQLSDVVFLVCTFSYCVFYIEQCFSTAGPRPGTGPWHQLYRAARSLRELQYATRFH